MLTARTIVARLPPHFQKPLLTKEEIKASKRLDASLIVDKPLGRTDRTLPSMGVPKIPSGAGMMSKSWEWASRK